MWAFYSNFPANTGLDLIRLLAAALYDVWIEMFVQNAEKNQKNRDQV